MENQSISITYAKNLTKQSFSCNISVPVDNNANIKNVLSVDSYLFDDKIECGNSKAVVSGKIGIKVVYLDTDNIFNTITDSQSFSETILDSSITTQCTINLCKPTIINNVLSTDGTLKINCEVSFNPILYINLSLGNKLTEFEGMVTKKSELLTHTIAQVVNCNMEYTCNLEAKENISKILAYNASFCATNVTAYDDYAVVEGKIYSHLMYESNANNETSMKELCDLTVVKAELSIAGLKKEQDLDISLYIDPSKTTIETDMEENNTLITITHCICGKGVAIKNVSVDLLDDIYSTSNEIEVTKCKREYMEKPQHESVHENISGESSLSEQEPAIDWIVANTCINPEITNTYIKDDVLYLEGLITSSLIYLDENKEYKTKQIELPFLVNTKLSLTKIDCVHVSVAVEDCKTKAKRGTIIELEYACNFLITYYTKCTQEIVDNVTIGKALDFSMYDYQIFLTKPNETVWDVCKRIKISLEDITKYNKNLPNVMDGTERIIIKR